MTRRDAIKKGAIVGGTVLWVTPLVQSVGVSSASAQTVSPPGGGCDCTGTESFDVRATFTGLVSGTVGPIQNFPEDNGCLANLTATIDGRTFLTAGGVADADCVGGTTAGGTCSSFVELANLAVDLSAINAAIDVQLDASVVRAEATCTCGGGCEARACITQTAGDAIVTIGGADALVAADVALCERTVIDVNIAGTLLDPPVTGTIVLNDTRTDPCQATVATIDVALGDLQTVSIVIARATAVCTSA